MIDEVPEATSKLTHCFIVTYHGSIVPARLPETVVEALTFLPKEISLQVIGYETVGHRGYVGYLRDLATKFGVSRRIEFVGAVSTRRVLLEHCARASVGLALMPTESSDINERYMTGASNKPFDYMACGLPVVVSDREEWVKMFVHRGYGVACDPERSESVAAALRRLFEDTERTKEMGLRARAQVLREWNYERQFTPAFQRMIAGTVMLGER